MFIIYLLGMSIFSAGSLVIAEIRGSYIGCYRYDVLGGAILPWAISSVRSCLEYCFINRDYTYAGVRGGGRMCHAGDRLPAEPNLGACNSTCLVSRSDTRCGGRDHVDIFTICPLGFYGKYCNITCPCEHEGVCHRIKGDCMCQGGYFGPTCAHQRCHEDNGGCDGRCHETADRSWCSCGTNFILQADNRTCQDVDECQMNNGGCAEECENTAGSYECRCGEGYQLDQDKRSCVDLDECSSDTTAGCEHLCHNSVGSYECICRPGYALQSDYKQCVHIDYAVNGHSHPGLPAWAIGTLVVMVVLLLAVIVLAIQVKRMASRIAAPCTDHAVQRKEESGIQVTGTATTEDEATRQLPDTFNSESLQVTPSLSQGERVDTDQQRGSPSGQNNQGQTYYNVLHPRQVEVYDGLNTDEIDPPVVNEYETMNI